MHVTLGREWANRGYVALRMDLAGLGDSVRYRTDAWISPVQTELGLLDQVPSQVSHSGVFAPEGSEVGATRHASPTEDCRYG